MSAATSSSARRGRAGIAALSPFTLLDYPGHTACILWFAGCNLRCPYCHNPRLVRGRGAVALSDITAFLDRRRGLLDGVVCSGGEPTLSPDLATVAAAARARGFRVKLDTNGTRPDVVAALLEAKLLDDVALDLKASPPAWAANAGVVRHGGAPWRTLARLMAAPEIGLTLRTTVHPGLLDEAAVSQILQRAAAAGFRGAFVLQHVVATGAATLGGVRPPRRRFDPARLVRPPGIELVLRGFR